MQKIPAPEIPDWIEKMLPERIVRYGVDVGGSQVMQVMESGEGIAFLMLHGNPTWGFLYRKIMAALEKQPVRCIVPDLIGLGFSSKPGRVTDHTLENHAAWMGSLIDQLNLDRLVFVGQDWGGPIGMRALADRPHLLGGLVI